MTLWYWSQVNPSPVVTGDSVDGLTSYLLNDTGETVLDELLSKGHLKGKWDRTVQTFEICRICL